MMGSIKMSDLVSNEESISSLIEKAKDGMTKEPKKTLWNVIAIIGLGFCFGVIIANCIQISTLNSKIEELEHQLESRTNELISNAKQLDSTTKKMNSKIEELDRKTEDLNSKTEDLSDENMKLNSRIDNLNSTAIETDSRIDDQTFAIKRIQAIIHIHNLTPRNCEEYGLQESGSFIINPEKQQGSEFEVYCNQTSTHINHDKTSLVKVESCKTDNCFKLELKYNTSMDDIRALISTSEECHQEVHFSCYLAKITGFAGFTDSDDKSHPYFHGNEKTLCRCHEQNNCFSPHMNVKNTCNCDVEDTFDRSDVIIVRDKSLLPLTAFSYNLMNQNTQRAMVKVGPLVCKGIRKISGDSCLNWRYLGYPSGYYALPLPSNNKEKDFEAKKCEMSQIDFEVKMEIHHVLKLEEDKDTPLKIDKLIIDGNEENEFYPPQTGGYDLHFKIQQNRYTLIWIIIDGTTTRGDCYLKKNKVPELSLKCTADYSWNTPNCTATCSKEEPCVITFVKALNF